MEKKIENKIIYITNLIFLFYHGNIVVSFIVSCLFKLYIQLLLLLHQLHLCIYI